MGLYFSAAAQDCRLLFSRVSHLTFRFRLLAQNIYCPWAAMSKDGRFQICRVLHQTVEMNVNANWWLSADILVTPETGPHPTPFILHGFVLVPLQVFSSPCSNSSWNGHCLSPVTLVHICRLPWHLVSKRIRGKKHFIHFALSTYPTKLSGLDTHMSCLSKLMAVWTTDTIYCVQVQSKPKFLLLPGQSAAGYHLFYNLCHFSLFNIHFLKHYLEDRMKAHTANVYIIAVMISSKIGQSDSQHNIKVKA